MSGMKAPKSKPGEKTAKEAARPEPQHGSGSDTSPYSSARKPVRKASK